MPRTARIAGYALGVLALVMALVYTYLRWDNYSALRTIIASRVENATGQQLTFNGPVSLEMGADSFLSFRDVVLTNPDWQFLRSTITVDEGRIGLDVPNVIAGGVGTVVQLNTVKVELDRPSDAKPLPDPPAPGAALSAPASPPLPKFDELQVERLIVMGDSVLGGRMLQLADLKVVPETEKRTRVEAKAQSIKDVAVTIVTDEIENGRAWSFSMSSPRSDLKAALEATTGRKLFLRALAQGKNLDLADVSSLLPPRDEASALKEEGKALLDAALDIPIGWLQLITANLDVRIGRLVGETLDIANVRVDGRADNGWISFAPIEATGGLGSMRGFAVLDAAALPASAEISFQARAFQPLGTTGSALDASVSLASAGRSVKSLYAFDGYARSFFENVPSPNGLYPVLFDPVFETFGDAQFPASCGVVETTFTRGRAEQISGQLYADKGRVALRGVIDFLGGLVDLEVAAEPYDAAVQYFDAVGSFNDPAISEDSRQAPWLTLDVPKDRICDLLNQQSQAVLDGR